MTDETIARTAETVLDVCDACGGTGLEEGGPCSWCEGKKFVRQELVPSKKLLDVDDARAEIENLRLDIMQICREHDLDAREFIVDYGLADETSARLWCSKHGDQYNAITLCPACESEKASEHCPSCNAAPLDGKIMHKPGCAQIVMYGSAVSEEGGQ